VQNSVVAAPDGTIYTTDLLKGTVFVYTQGTGWSVLTPSRAVGFKNLAVDTQYRVYTPGTGVGGVRRVVPSTGAALAGLTGGVTSIASDTRGGLYAVGLTLQLFGNYQLPFDLAYWNGYTWIPADFIGDITKTVNAVALSTDGTLYVGGQNQSIGTAASITTVVNRGAAATFPTLRLRNNAAGTARVYQLLNTTDGTQTGIWLNYIMTPGERAVLNLTPGERAFTSSVSGNILGRILGGSNLASWRLQPGTNTNSFFADNPNVEASLFWDLRNWSADAEQ
jgi:hypothetical protein